ncbi:MAG: hypothetical protein KDD65_15370, partial [Bacteroidetes bacterium]|nr:hypothetical protein [Bacteroidota bacterium]
QQKEIQDTVKLLTTMRTVAGASRDYALLMEKGSELALADTTTFGQMDMAKFRRSNPIPSPEILRQFLANDLISRHVSSFSHQQLYLSFFDLEKVASTSDYGTYARLSDRLVKVIDSEVAYQEGEIDMKELRSKSSLE